MALASTSLTQLSYQEETALGVTPVVGTPKNLRMTGESLSYKRTSASSEEINATRQTADSVHVDADASGGINIEFSYREYDPFLESLLSSTFSTAFGTDGVKALTVTIVAAAGTITDDGTDGFAGLVAGQYFSLSGTASNDGVYRIQSMTNDVLTVDTDTPLKADETARPCSVSSSRLTTGTAALRAFSIQKLFSDVGQYFIYRGMAPGKLDLSFDTGSVLKGSIGFTGMSSERGVSTFFSGAATPSQAHGMIGPVAGIGSILLDGNKLADTYIKSASLSVDGALRGQKALGYLGNVGIGQGTFTIGGNLSMYLASGAIYDMALANQTVSVEIPVFDTDGNGYAFIFQHVKLDVPEVPAGGKDQDVMLSVPFRAIAPSSTDKALIVDRFGVAAA